MIELPDGSLTSGEPILDSDGDARAVIYPGEVIPLFPPPIPIEKAIEGVRLARVALTSAEQTHKIDVRLLEESSAVLKEAKNDLGIAVYRLLQSLGCEPTR